MKQAAKTFAVVAILLNFVVIPAGAASSPGGHRLGQMAPARFGNPTTTVFINELHYDNAGTDAGEAVEIAGPAGTDLTGWSLVLYNGANGAAYNTNTLSGVIAEGDPRVLRDTSPNPRVREFLNRRSSMDGAEGDQKA